MHPRPAVRGVALLAATAAAGALTLLVSTPSSAAEANWVHRTLFASPDGVGQDCTSDDPCSLEGARDKVRTMNADMKGDIVVNLLDGTYVLDSTFELTENATIHDSGTNGFDVIYRNAPGATPVISGGEHLDGSAFTLVDPDKNIYRANVSADLESRYLYVNDARATRARSTGNPGFATTSTGYTIPATGTYSDMASWGNVSDIEVAATIKWRHARFSVESITGTAMKMDNPGWAESNTQAGYAARTMVWIENAYELLDTGGEWYLDTSADTVFYIPRDGEAIDDSEFVLSRTTQLVRAGGTSDNPLRNVRFDGLTFAHDNWTDPSGPIGYPDAQGGVVYRGPGAWEDNHFLTPAGVSFEAAHDIAVTNSTFTHMGNAALAFGAGSQDNLIDHNTFTDISGNGINVGGITKADHHPTDPASIVRGNTVSNNTVTKVGSEFRDNVAILLGYTQGSDVRNNTLFDLPYTGISMGWGWGYVDTLGTSVAGGNVIRGNLIYDFMKTMPDGGGIYTLGNQPGSQVVDNYLYGDQKIYGNIYHDNGSGGFHDTNNVISKKDSPLNVWLNLNTGKGGYWNAHDNRIEANYHTAGMTATGVRGSNVVTGNIPVTDDSWPAGALEVIANAGVDGDPITPVQVGDRPISRDKPATASSAADAQGPGLAVDGDPSTRWAPATEDDAPTWLQVDLGEDHYISETSTTAYLPKGKGALYRIEVSGDGETWTTYADRSTTYVVPGRDAADTPVRARYVRITILSCHGPGGGLSEFEVFGSPVPPVSQGKPATASSSYSTAYGPDRAVDGDPTTRWAQASGAPDPSSLTVDLGTVSDIARVETQAYLAYGKPVKYRIDYSTDGATWTTYADHTAAYVTPGTDTTPVPVSARYLRITLTNTQGQGGSIYEFRAFGH